MGRADRPVAPEILSEFLATRRVGLTFLGIGLGGFLVASGAHAHYPEAWESARWMILGVAVMGLVFTILPGKTEPR